MRHLLLCGGVHGNPRSLIHLRQAATYQCPDGIFFVGSILSPSRRCEEKMTPWSLTLEDSRFIEEFFHTLGGLQTFSAVIPGPAGEPMEEFLRLGMQAELAFPHVRIAHGTLIEEKEVAVCGLGGVLADRPLLGIDHYLRPTAEYFLRSLRWTRKPRTVLLLPAPPPGRLGGSDGDPLIGDLIDSFHPDLCVVRGSSDRRGTQRIGRTLVVNPGSLSDGWTAWLDWDRPAEDRVKFVNSTDLGYEGGECEECAAPHTRRPECEGVRWS
jgi:hypothetical protein